MKAAVDTQYIYFPDLTLPGLWPVPQTLWHSLTWGLCTSVCLKVLSPDSSTPTASSSACFKPSLKSSSQ